LKSWIQVLPWLLPLNVALGTAQHFLGPLPVFLVGRVRQSPSQTGAASSKRWGVCSTQLMCLAYSSSACVGIGCQSARPQSSRLWSGDRRRGSWLLAWKGFGEEVGASLAQQPSNGVGMAEIAELLGIFRG
jgi:hypothetical protein